MPARCSWLQAVSFRGNALPIGRTRQAVEVIYYSTDKREFTQFGDARNYYSTGILRFGRPVGNPVTDPLGLDTRPVLPLPTTCITAEVLGEIATFINSRKFSGCHLGQFLGSSFSFDTGGGNSVEFRISLKIAANGNSGQS